MATTGVVVGRVVEVRVHPRGEHIWLAHVDVGPAKLQIVWGGVKLVEAGHLVPVAKPGAKLPCTNGKKLRRRHYRGEISEGMLCSLAELGWDLSVTDRVAILDETADIKVGESLDGRFVDWERIVRPAGIAVPVLA